jgi:hypothetical protein
MYLKIAAVTILAGMLFSCKQESKEAKEQMSAEQKTGEWTSLFDGSSLKGWRNYRETKVGPAWKVVDGTLMLDPSSDSRGGDLLTDEEFENFELELEWKIDSCGNSGIIFNVVEDPEYSEVWETGPEMQVLDNTCHPDAKIIKHRAGDLYDLISCSTETVKPAGEWNAVRIISQNASYEFYLNGSKIVSFTMHTPEWDEMIRNSKFKDMPAFGKSTRGHIALQDHGNKVWFRNIRIKKLN